MAGAPAFARTGNPGTDPDPAALTTPDWARAVWKTALAGDERRLGQMLDAAPVAVASADKRFMDSVALYRANLEKRATLRQKRIEEISAELDTHLAEGDDPISLSHALRSAVELDMVVQDKEALIRRPNIASLIERAAKAGHEAEREGKWLLASELFYRLDALLQEDGTFKADADRQTRRLAMLAMYSPARLWELRNERRIREGEDPLPPFNSIGTGYQERLHDITADQVRIALGRAARKHVDPDHSTYADLLLGGLSSLEVMLNTKDLREPLPALADDAARERLIAYLDEQQRAIEADRDRVDRLDLLRVLNGLVETNRTTVGLPEYVLLYEFGNGAMGVLDDYSAIIWPHELRRFERHTQARFVGVGIQIQLDELFNIKVVTPLEGTPAQRAGIRADDLIVGINGQSTAGFTLDQAVDVITGPENTEVTLTVKRQQDGKQVELDLPMKRAGIDLVTVKGWQRHGVREDDWDWFIDPDSGIGYVRLTSFSSHTTREFDEAIRQMKEHGLGGLILDLRFNPGGLLNEAVSVASRFISKDIIVTTQDGQGKTLESQWAHRGQASLGNIPVAVLINEGSASASEIVSGAIQDHAHWNDLDAILIGQRSFGKGSVQQVWPLDRGSAAMKLTTQYYALPSGRVIHRKPGASQWGIEPDLKVSMLPGQITDALTIRRDTDVLPIDENGDVVPGDEPRPDPSTLLTDGVDLQLETALVVLQSQTLPERVADN